MLRFFFSSRRRLQLVLDAGLDLLPLALLLLLEWLAWRIVAVVVIGVDLCRLLALLVVNGRFDGLHARTRERG